MVVIIFARYLDISWLRILIGIYEENIYSAFVFLQADLEEVGTLYLEAKSSARPFHEQQRKCISS